MNMLAAPPSLISRAPRYTSYPTAPHFHAGVDEAAYRRWLSELTDSQTLSLYLHIPFCAQMCWYCGCNMKVVKRSEPIERYLETLLHEMALLREAIGADPVVRRVHFGGGTPNTLSPEQFARVVAALKASFRVEPGAEWAVEIDPRLLTPEQVEGYARLGVGRVSLGAQDFDAKVQEAINRVQPYEQVAGSVAMLRAAGVSAINFDLLYGLPHQTAESIQRSAELTAELRPSRVALFGYAHAPWMAPNQKMIPEDALPGPEARLDQAAIAADILAAAGYERIGLDHFALPDDALAVAAREGRLKRNFQGYTDDAEDALLGLGMTAIGALPQGYVQNHHDERGHARAVAEGRLPIGRGLALTEEDVLRREIIERLMCDLAIDLAPYEGRLDFSEDLRKLAPLIEAGLARLEGSRVVTIEEARPFVRAVAACFDAYLGKGAARHTATV